MAAKKKGKTNKPAKSDTLFTISAEKKKKIIGILLILFSVLLLLSIISYSRYDKAILNYRFSDLFRVFKSNSDFSQKADATRNWLGIFGAYVSDFFINSTIGIFSVIFPVMFFSWGLAFFKKINFRKLIHTTNFLLMSGFILSAAFGVLRIHYRVFYGAYEISGSVGDYLGEALSRLLGGIGSLMFLFASGIILLIFAFDIKIESIFHFIKNFFTSSIDKVKEELENSKVEEEDTNLKENQGTRER